MIKIFSPERFNDYDDQTAYGCIFQNKDKIYSLNVEDFTKAIENEYPSLINGNWANVTDFLQAMVDNNTLSPGSGVYEITNYYNLAECITNWYTIPTKKKKIKDFNSYINCVAFAEFVVQNEDLFKDSVSVETRLHNMASGSTRILEDWSEKSRIIDMAAFRQELKDMLANPSEDTVNKLLENTETGINTINKTPLLTYILELLNDQVEEFVIDGVKDYIDGQGNIVDLSPYNGIIRANTVPGYSFFGITKRNKKNWYLDRDKLIDAVTALSYDKYVAVSPQEFIQEQIDKNLITVITDGLTYRYRITNIDIFRTNYSMYRIGINVSDKGTNGDMVLMPTSAELETEINGAWTVTIKHPYDSEGRNSFIEKGSVISLPIKVAREQVYPNQLFRVYDVENALDGIEVVGYPVAQESAFECPVDQIKYENKTAKEVASELTGKYPEKYLIETDINSGRKSISVKNSNLQEVIAGSDEATFLNAYGGEIIYDNYIYRIRKQAGRKEKDAKDYMITYSSNITGMKINENTFDVITRIYPTSEDDYNFDSIMAAYKQYSDEYGELTQKSVSSMYFVFEEFIQYIMSLDDDIPRIEAEMRRLYDETNSSGVNITTDLMNKIIRLYSDPVDQRTVIECIRFVNKLVYNKIAIASRDSSTIKADDYVSFAMGGNNDVINSADLFGYTIYLENEKWSEITVNNNDFTEAIPVEFTSELSKLRNSALAREILTVTYAHKPVYVTTIPRYIDSDNIRSYPFVHARSIKYDEIKLINKYDKDSKKEKTKSEQLVEDAMAAIKNKTTELSKEYIKKAHNGDWKHEKRIKIKKKNIHYTGDDAKTHLHTNSYDPRKDRVCLPYGYIFNSYKDAIEYLKYEAVMTWCTDKNEAEILCDAIENGFKWCENTKIAKWMWHNDGIRYYGTKKGTKDWNAPTFAYHKISNKMYWLNGKAHIKQWDGCKTMLNLEDYDDFKWVDHPYEVDKTKKNSKTGEEEPDIDKDTGETKKVTKHRYRYQNKDGKYLTSCWIEESASKHYWVDADGYRVDDNEANKEATKKTDTDPWTFKPGKDGETYRITGYRYGNHDKGYYPVSGQFMNIKDHKGWFKFVDSDAGAGTIQGNYLSSATWAWKKYKRGWRYTDGNRSYITWQWAKIDGMWYYFPPGGGYADTTTDDFKENSKSFNSKSKHPEVDYNLEGVNNSKNPKTSKTDSSDASSTTNSKSFDANRDGVQAWIQSGFIKKLKKEILKWHLAIWDQLRESLWNAAENDIQTLRSESLSVEIDFVQLRNYSGYEQFSFLEDLYLGDYVHVRSSLHNFDSDLRVVSIKYDCITNRPIGMTLGYPTNSFIRRSAQQNKAGTVKFYSPVEYIEDGYGDLIEDGTIVQPYIPAK